MAQKNGKTAPRGGPATFEDLARSTAQALGPDVDFDVLTAALNIIRISSLLTQDLESRVHRPSGSTWAGFRVMFAVLVKGGAEPREVARLAGVSRASVSSVLNTLERDGLVERKKSSADRRVVTVRLTERGRRATIEAFRGNHEVEKAWLAPLKRSEVEALNVLLHRIHSPARSKSADPASVQTLAALTRRKASATTERTIRLRHR